MPSRKRTAKTAKPRATRTPKPQAPVAAPAEAEVVQAAPSAEAGPAEQQPAPTEPEAPEAETPEEPETPTDDGGEAQPAELETVDLGGVRRPPQTRAGRQRAVSPGRRVQGPDRAPAHAALDPRAAGAGSGDRRALRSNNRVRAFVGPEIGEGAEELLRRRRHAGRCNQPFLGTGCCGNHRCGGRGGGSISPGSHASCGQACTLRGR
jgi:hypothetical protein